MCIALVMMCAGMVVCHHGAGSCCEIIMGHAADTGGGINVTPTGGITYYCVWGNY